MALALRTDGDSRAHTDSLYKLRRRRHARQVCEREIHLQAGAEVVAARPESEYQETVNKAAALGRAIDLAEERAHV